jgi:hypothetical protein
MIEFAKIIKVPGVATVISFVLGVGIAAMFRPVCKGPECVLVRGPPIQDIRDAVYQFGTKCVEFKPRAVECPKKGTVPIVDTVSFADYEPSAR